MTILFPNRTRRATVAVAAVTVMSLGLAGCGGLGGLGAPDDFGANSIVLDAKQRHPILVSQQPHKLTLRIARGAPGLSPSQRASVIDFFGKYGTADAGNSKLVISVPSGSANEIAAMNAVAEIRPLLSEHGFVDSAVSVEPYHADGDPQPPLRIAYMRFAAEGPDCGKWPTNLSESSRNVNYENFGCAQQKNLAAMVANPADLLGPRTMTPSSAGRRDTTWDKYVKGDPSGTVRTSDERAAVSK
jgi:pilus assembly protein CpaD